MLAPGAIVGIVGGGQLGRMLAQAASRMGYQPLIYTPDADSPASQVSPHCIVAPYDDAEALQQFADSCDVITFEFENVPAESLELLEQHCAVHPGPKVLKTCRHRLREKQSINAAFINTAPYEAVNSLEALHEAIEALGTPCVLKSCEMGYDGKGQVKINAPEEAGAAWEALGTTDAILEGWIRFQCEASIIVARDAKGQRGCYDMALNLHENHILSRSCVPANLPLATQHEAARIAMHLAERLNLIGILAVEFFVMHDGSLLVNELAPRPHNSGHWTIEAAATSQFEQLIRIITGHALGDMRTLCAVEMINLIGECEDRLKHYSQQLQAHLHWYGKKQARQGRKMGHVTLLK